MGFMSAGLQGGPHSLLRGYGEHERQGFNWWALLSVAQFVLPYRRMLALAVALMLVAAAAQLAGPYVIKVAIDGFIAQHDVRGLIGASLALLAIFAGGAYASAGQALLTGRLGQAVLRDLRSRLFAHMQRLPMAYYDRADSGRLISHMVSDVSVINELLTSGIVALSGDLIILLGIIGIMLAMSARLALLSFMVIPVMILLTAWFSHAAARMYRRTRQKVGVMIGRLAEDLATVRVIRAFAKEGEASGHFEHTNRENRDANIAAISLAFAFRPAVDLLAAIASLIVIWFGGRFAAAGAVSVGTVVAFLSYVSRFFAPIQELSQLFTTVQSAAAGAERILGLLQTPVTIADAPRAVPLEGLQGEVELRDVWFSYAQDKPALRGVSFHVAPGEKVAIVGPTGAGKSTIAKLLLRYYDVDEGQVLIDGRDVREVTLQSLRRQVGVVPQEPFLFAATIRDNIRFGRPEASDEEVREAARLARADAFIERLPHGYDTWVQEGAVNLSLGQRQLLCLARAILCRPKLVILDEATSSVDTQTERLIQEALRVLLQGRTAIVIAHRLATVREVDRIIVLDRGRIVEEGTHAELLRRPGVYRRLYEAQMASAAAAG
jgi:ABC-type multidrug transport system fused ATPase/permease subunit